MLNYVFVQIVILLHLERSYVMIALLHPYAIGEIPMCCYSCISKQIRNSCLMLKKLIRDYKPCFLTYKLNNEKAKLSVLLRSAISCNALKADTRNMPFEDSKL